MSTKEDAEWKQRRVIRGFIDVDKAYCYRDFLIRVYSDDLVFFEVRQGDGKNPWEVTCRKHVGLGGRKTFDAAFEAMWELVGGSYAVRK